MGLVSFLEGEGEGRGMRYSVFGGRNYLKIFCIQNPYKPYLGLTVCHG